MRYLWVLLLPLFCFAAPFKVASYNVENLFDADYQGTEYQEYDPRKGRWNQRLVEVKLNRVSEVICDINADIIGLQEIENSRVFNALIKRLKRVGCAYPYRAVSYRKKSSVQTALLSRFPIIKEKEVAVAHSPRIRNILEVEVDIEGHALLLFVNHWKSKGYNGFESKRIKYAKALQKRLHQLSSTQEYILLGDFNTDYDANLNLEKKINDTGGKTGLHTILKSVDKEKMFTHSKGLHYSLWHELKYIDRWSTKFYSKKGTPDHLLIPSTMLDGRGLSYVDGSFKVFRGRYLFVRAGYIKRWSYKKGGGYSDHLPISALFDSKPFERKASLKPLPSKRVGTIEQLYGKRGQKSNLLLKDVVVVWKHGNSALIKQSVEGRGIFLYGCTKGLKEGKQYDILVKEINDYRGLRQVTHLSVLKQGGSVNRLAYMLDASDLSKPIAQRQNEMIHNIEGIYKKGYFYTEGRKLPVYFRKSVMTPPDNSRLKIDYAHLGYYKKLQLVLYSNKDFRLMER